MLLLFAQRQPLILRPVSKEYQNRATSVYAAVFKDGVHGHRVHNHVATEDRSETTSAHVLTFHREDKRG